MSKLEGKIIAKSPVYRGNAAKTLFARDGSAKARKQRLISLKGAIEKADIAKARMDAFLVDNSIKRDDRGVLGRIWKRLYSEDMPNGVVQEVNCTLLDDRNPKERFFNLRMGIALDRDSMTQQKFGGRGMNYKLETVYQGAEFDFCLKYGENLRGSNRGKLARVIVEMTKGRMSFGAGKSKGMGQTQLVLNAESKRILEVWLRESPELATDSNSIIFHIEFDAEEPFLVGWPWGNIDEVGRKDPWISNEITNRHMHAYIKSFFLEDSSVDEQEIVDTFQSEIKNLKEANPHVQAIIDEEYRMAKEKIRHSFQSELYHFSSSKDPQIFCIRNYIERKLNKGLSRKEIQENFYEELSSHDDEQVKKLWQVAKQKCQKSLLEIFLCEVKQFFRFHPVKKRKNFDLSIVND